MHNAGIVFLLETVTNRKKEKEKRRKGRRKEQIADAGLQKRVYTITHNYIPKPAPVRSQLHHFPIKRIGPVLFGQRILYRYAPRSPKHESNRNRSLANTFRNRQTIKPARTRRSPLAAECWISGHISGYRASICVVQHATKR